MGTSHFEATIYSKENSESPITIGIAKTPEEKDEIYRFRYQIYVEEMAKHILDIDHTNRLLYDTLDEWALLLYAKMGSQLIATARINIGTFEDFPPKLIDFLSLSTFQDSYTNNRNPLFAYAAKLMIAPAHRSSTALYMLIAKGYELWCSNQVQFAFAACNFHLLRLYEQMGFQRYSKNFIDPGYGLLAPIVLLINDIEHLRMVRSPLFRLARKRGNVDTRTVEWFRQRAGTHSSIINSQTVAEEELWLMLSHRLDCLPTAAIRLLQGLSVDEAKKILHCCSCWVHCDPGDLITNQGDVSYSHNILISGKLKSLTFQLPAKNYTLPGQDFGANGLTEHNPHTEDIIAVEPAEILVLSGLAFQKFYHSYPDIAHKVVQRIRHLTRS